MDIQNGLRRALCGISGVHATAYTAEGGVDAGLTGRIVERIVDGGIHNVVAAGNTGEFYALSPDEVRLVHDTAVSAARGRSNVVAAIGRSLTEAIALGRRAKDAGANAIMSHQPLDPFAAPQAQAAYFRAIADAVDLPLVAYVRSDAMGLADLLSVANHPNVVGVKFATTNLMLLAECVRSSDAGTAVWVCGLAEGWAAPFYALGARGFTSGLVNVDPARSLAIHAALEAGDYAKARALVGEIARFETLRTRYGNGANVTVVKEALGLLGFPAGAVRLPGLPALDPADRETLVQEIARWGIGGR
ncbi:dihydrodipicolinate synthase family protein [Mycobacterium sp. KBS0706]|uniref:dihydrodipicolinate synthase family protein n=1 Tax=Mycobacterium sp. KBS0706 TaxID=2578109 RepID=UPI00110FBF0F|nr:dihydrodipicolinate synthase family protein [Mycobacterium sp. KBS0706]TSD89918.1 dihydrodipicolinate synthase family protein [Mycobacterium sp. KBS0706]